MGLLMRRRRPLMRVAAGAAVGTAAYQAGKRRAEQDGVDDQGQAGYAATQPAAAPAPASAGPTAELERLTQLHASGALTDTEFAAAKSRLLGT